MHKLLHLSHTVATIHAEECPRQVDSIVAVEFEADLVEVAIFVVLRPLQIISLLSIDLVALALEVLALLLAERLVVIEGLLVAALVVELASGTFTQLGHELGRGR